MSALRRRQLERWRDADSEIAEALESDRTLRERVFAVLDASEALGDHLIAHPGEWRVLLGDASREPLSLMESHDIATLRIAYRGRLLQICADDLTGRLDVAAVAAELSDLADATLAAALRISKNDLPSEPGAARLSIIAMGKCGARELNYLSDVDVLFVAEGDLSVANRWAASLMTICGQVAWQVDAQLRPEGRNGALVRTIDSYVAYYKKWAHTWEFQALMKARPAAGDSELGQQWLSLISPLVWQTVENSQVVDEIRAMRRRVVSSIPKGKADRQLKLGTGGLRDIEFAVQLMQLVHGRNDHTLHVKSTLDALAALIDGGYLGRADGEALSDAYRFLRIVEHRLQLQKLRRTQLIPDDPAALHWLSRLMGFAGADDFRHEWRRHASVARRLHEKLFYRPLLEAVAEVPVEGLRLTSTAAKARLVALGFADPVNALRHISALIAGVSRTAAIQRTLLPVLLGEFAAAPEPDRGLLSYRKVSEKLGSTSWYLRSLRDAGPVAMRLARILATSRYAADLLLRDPAALRLLSNDGDLAPRPPDVLLGGMKAAVARHTGAPESAVSAIRAIRRRELLRIAFGDLLGFTPITDVGPALSDVTDSVLDAALTIAAGEHPDAPTLSVIGMGRLGGRESSYSSDADVIFVFDDESRNAAAEATAVVERLRSLLSASGSEPPVKVDVSLRPEGRQGPIVRSLTSYKRYYQRWSKTWEAQALLRARFCAGDREIADRFMRLVDPVRYPDGGLSTEQLIEIRRIKARVDTERLPRNADRATHVKLGPGGLTDVEWNAQLLQLQHAYTYEDLRTTSTIRVLENAANNELISHEDADALTVSWYAASSLRNALMLAKGTPSDQLPRQGPELASVLAVLRMDEQDDPGRAVDEYLRVARHAHMVAERLFYEE